VDLPLLARIATCVAIATPGFVAIRRLFLLRGRGSVRALSWSGDALAVRVRLAYGEAEIPVSLARGSFRLGSACLLLWLRAPGQVLFVFIDGNRQEVGGFRRLCRLLRWPPRVP